MIALNDLKRLLILGGSVWIGLLILVGILKLTLLLLGILVPAIFVVGAVYLGYRWWQRHGRRMTGRRPRW